MKVFLTSVVALSIGWAFPCFAQSNGDAFKTLTLSCVDNTGQSINFQLTDVKPFSNTLQGTYACGVSMKIKYIDQMFFVFNAVSPGLNHLVLCNKPYAVNQDTQVTFKVSMIAGKYLCEVE